jgi:hypothetical protein
LHNYQLSIFLAVALDDADLMSVAEQIGDAQLTNFADAQSRRIRCHEQGTVPPVEFGMFEEFSSSWTPYTLGRSTGFFIWGNACSMAVVGRWSTLLKKKGH